jgi:hypothetical protein
MSFAKFFISFLITNNCFQLCPFGFGFLFLLFLRLVQVLYQILQSIVCLLRLNSLLPNGFHNKFSNCCSIINSIFEYHNINVLPKTCGVFTSVPSMGVPVKPMYVAFGKASRIYFAKPYAMRFPITSLVSLSFTSTNLLQNRIGFCGLRLQLLQYFYVRKVGRKQIFGLRVKTFEWWQIQFHRLLLLAILLNALCLSA